MASTDDNGDSRVGERPGEPVTVTVARHIAPGRERDFEAWYDGITACAARFPGYLGGGVLRPHRPGLPWHVVYRFRDAATLRAWEESPQRHRWLERAEGLVDQAGQQRVTGLETWFDMPGRTAPAPPRWKMAVITFAAIYPLALLVNAVLVPRTRTWPLLAKPLLFAGILVPTMTWVVMPRLTRLARSWLYPRR